MKKPRRKPTAGNEHDRDTLRPEYDFSTATRGAIAGRFREGTNVVIVDPSVLDVFPDSNAVNEALRALAPILRRRRAARERERE